MKNILLRFFQNPVSFTKLIFDKLFIYPYKYKKGDDYNAEQYWKDRFKKHQMGINGPGHEGATIKENMIRYQKITKTFKNICSANIKNIKDLTVLEIGVGTGLITESLKELGVVKYTGIDITDVLFDDVRKKFPDYLFLKADVTKDELSGNYDVIVIIDVIEHIVKFEKFKFAFSNLNNCLNNTGYIIIAPLTTKKQKRQFYEHHWTKEDLTPLSKYTELQEIEWTKNFSSVVIFKKTQ